MATTDRLDARISDHNTAYWTAIDSAQAKLAELQAASDFSDIKARIAKMMDDLTPKSNVVHVDFAARATLTRAA